MLGLLEQTIRLRLSPRLLPLTEWGDLHAK